MGTHEVIATLENTFSGMDLPACISLIDSDGLVVYSVGACEEQWVLESLNAHLIMSFESTLEKLILLNEVLDSLVISAGNKVFYINDLRGGQGLYIVVQTSPNLMNKVLPFLKNVVDAMEATLTGKDSI